MVDLVGKKFSDLIFGRQNIASIGDFGVKKNYPISMNFVQPV